MSRHVQVLKDANLLSKTPAPQTAQPSPRAEVFDINTGWPERHRRTANNGAVGTKRDRRVAWTVDQPADEPASARSILRCRNCGLGRRRCRQEIMVALWRRGWASRSCPQ